MDSKSDRAILLQSIKQRCRHESNFWLSWIQRLFYTFKFVVCWVMNWQPDYSSFNTYDYNSVRVAVYNSGNFAAPGEPTVHWFEEVRVMRGLGDWKFFFNSDSD